MKHKTNIIIFALLILSISASAQIQFTAGLNYESGVPSGAPSSTGSRIRVNLATGRAYIWNQAGSNWRVLAQGIDIVAGCSAPLYTPGYGQSLFAVNGCASPDLYYYTGTAWVQINAGGGGGGTTYYAGEGIDITNDTISVDTVQRLSFRTDQTYSDGLGTLSWDDTNGTLQLGLKGGNVSLQLGQESVQLVKHADNTGLSNGKVVYLTGSSGGNLTVRYAQANSESTSANTLGVMTEDATGGNKGFCTTFGLVHNINTSNLTEGGMVWLSKDTAGAMTAVRPTAPNNGVEVGFCVTKHATNGVIFVTVQNGYELDELHNVYVPSPTNGQVLTYNTTSARWEAATVADQSATNEIQTIDTFSLSGQTLSASLSSDNQPAKTVTLPIVDVVAGTNVTVTKSNGVATVSATGGGAPTGAAGGDLSGTYPNPTVAAIQGRSVSSTAPSANQVLAWNSGTSAWTPTAVAGTGTVTGTGTATQLAFWNGTSSLSSSSLLNWDNSNSRLAVGPITTASQRVQISGTAGQTPGFRILNSGITIPNFSGVGYSPAITTTTVAMIEQAGGSDGGIAINGFSATTGGIQPLFFTGVHGVTSSGTVASCLFRGFKWNGTNSITAVTSDEIVAEFSAGNTAVFDIRANGNANLGSKFTPAARLEIRGAGTTSGYGLLIRDSGSSNVAMAVQDNLKVGIRTSSIDTGAALEVDGTTGGILFPRLTTTERNALTPVNGLMIYNTTDNKFQGYAGGAWVDLH